jgi:hypothetical protein
VIVIVCWKLDSPLKHVAAGTASSQRCSETNVMHFLFNLLRIKGLHMFRAGPDSSVGIATGYVLDSPGIESRWGRDSSHTSRLALVPTQSPVQWVPGSSPGVKQSRRGADHPPPSSAKIMKE